jgi:hypothetical protein
VLRRETRKGTTHRLLILVVTKVEFSGLEFASWKGLQDILESRFNERSRRLCSAAVATPSENFNLAVKT